MQLKTPRNDIQTDDIRAAYYTVVALMVGLDCSIAPLRTCRMYQQIHALQQLILINDVFCSYFCKQPSLKNERS